MNRARAMGLAAAAGALLTVVILAMSVLLRLGTRLVEGEATSILPPAIELGARMVHRVAAMGVGLLAALALVARWRLEPPIRPSARAVAAVVGLTLLLSVAGRYSTGYRFDTVTMLNVAGGIALAAAFWALRPRASGTGDPVALAALALLILLAASGALVDAQAMRGARAFGPLHLWFAVLFTGLALTAAWRQRSRVLAAGSTAAIAIAQLVLGIALLAGGGSRPIGLGWFHAMAACVLALLLVGLGLGGRVRAVEHLE